MPDFPVFGDDPRKCRARAFELFALGHASVSTEERLQLLRAAQSWIELAETLERERESLRQFG
jgi:hypothetical protein